MSHFDSLLRNKSAETRIAVVGASNDPNKYGHIITRELVRHRYTILPVNPRESTVLGLPVVPSVDALTLPIHIVNVVTPPPATQAVLSQCAAAGLTNVWLQPGSFDAATLEHGRALRTPSGQRLLIESVACIMVVARAVGP